MLTDLIVMMVVEDRCGLLKELVYHQTFITSILLLEDIVEEVYFLFQVIAVTPMLISMEWMMHLEDNNGS